MRLRLEIRRLTSVVPPGASSENKPDEARNVRPEFSPPPHRKSDSHFGKTPVVRVSLFKIFPQETAENRETAFVSRVSNPTIRIRQSPPALKKRFHAKTQWEQTNPDSDSDELFPGALCAPKLSFQARECFRTRAHCVLFPLRLCVKILFQKERAGSRRFEGHKKGRSACAPRPDILNPENYRPLGSLL